MEFLVIVDPSNITLPENTSMFKALERLESSKIKIILLIDKNGKLTGTCTDGDFRRAIIRLGKVQGSVADIASANPFSVSETTNPGILKSLLNERNIKHIPLVDNLGHLKGLYVDTENSGIDNNNIPIVLMAGGLGRRLSPLTENCPKPLLPLGNKPILEHIILRFKEQGFKRFYISINYLGHMIEDYFGSGDSLGVKISYLRENKRLGTGGALNLLPDNMNYPLIVMNGDLLIESDFSDMVTHHKKSEAAATMCVREYLTVIPFGVVQFEGSTYLGVEEKPTLKHYINTGIYCLSKAAVEYVPDNEFFDMPTLFERLERENINCSVHLIRDSWLDVGSLKDYTLAKEKYSTKENIS